jgi:hypothetical protein
MAATGTAALAADRRPPPPHFPKLRISGTQNDGLPELLFTPGALKAALWEWLSVGLPSAYPAATRSDTAEPVFQRGLDRLETQAQGGGGPPVRSASAFITADCRVS